eukprot:6174177-Lingulodinium_polyedra.AAC.1
MGQRERDVCGDLASTSGAFAGSTTSVSGMFTGGTTSGSGMFVGGTMSARGAFAVGRVCGSGMIPTVASRRSRGPATGAAREARRSRSTGGNSPN